MTKVTNIMTSVFGYKKNLQNDDSNENIDIVRFLIMNIKWFIISEMLILFYVWEFQDEETQATYNSKSWKLHVKKAYNKQKYELRGT